MKSNLNARINLICGLYAITPDEADTAELLRKVRLALLGGARVIQYRNKAAEAALRLFQAEALRELTREFDVPLIVNDDATLAQQVDADGVHLGGEDGSVSTTRALLGSGRLIGVSCYNRLALAHEAVLQGADYVAFGSFFTSTVKPDAVVATPDLLRQARRELAVPLVAIGGITAQNGVQLLESGANALAVISAVFSAPDIEGAAREFSNLYLSKANRHDFA
ncbi:MAG: thiamine-phosphate diphosphorylase [Gallionellales bacterium RIFCSPLOWO2_02_FULL_57_47]|nr:MAG: thiamine-phosphate diphosphorylase [Gallionellales bacterium RIFCSPLOWO2_02_FULL_57_47]OGT07543.1 MAG: thiamine-phosphate diphosphorylase [Gallionellales bacterium RIFCSPHIGHO2_02_FULL_57_16]